MEENISHVTKVLELLKRHNLFVKAEKCVFHLPKVEFLGYEISAEGIYMDSKKVEAIREWPIPSDILSLQSFLGFANYYHRFIHNYSKLAFPLTSLLRKSSIWNWNSNC